MRKHLWHLPWSVRPLLTLSDFHCVGVSGTEHPYSTGCHIFSDFDFQRVFFQSVFWRSVPGLRIFWALQVYFYLCHLNFKLLINLEKITPKLNKLGSVPGLRIFWASEPKLNKLGSEKKCAGLVHVVRINFQIIWTGLDNIQWGMEHL